MNRKHDLTLYVIISGKKLRGKFIYPRVPKNRMEDEEDEDDYIKRICCSNSIPGCIRGIGILNGESMSNQFWVYQLILTGYEQILTPKQVQVSVADAMDTGEWWVLNPCKYKYIGRLVKNTPIPNPKGRIKEVYSLEK